MMIDRAAALSTMARKGKIALIEHRHKGLIVLKVLCADKERLIGWGVTKDDTVYQLTLGAEEDGQGKEEIA